MVNMKIDDVLEQRLMTNIDVIRSLNIVLSNELSAINQYFLHSRILLDQGFNKLADFEYKESIEEMQHADMLIKRILEIGGFPNMHDLPKLYIGQNPQDIIENDYKMEEVSCRDLINAIKTARDNSDYTSAAMLENILKSEEEHIAWLRRQMNIINVVGIKEYIIQWMNI